MIELRALGTSEIETSVMTLTPSHQIVFAAALYLVLEPGRRVRRSRLASLLWPNAPDRSRAHRLRQTILQLKKVGVPVRADRDNVQLLQQDARSDVDQLAQAAPQINLPKDSLEFLPGYSPRFSEPFRDWVDSRRDDAHAALSRRLVMDLELARSRADWSGCERIAKRCRQLDPFNESAVLAQAEAAAMRGAKTEAIALLDRHILDLGGVKSDLVLPPSLLRRRIAERVPDRPPTGARESIFVGRTREMEALISCLAGARKGAGGACLLTGEPGIGKTRLTSELVKLAELEGIQTQRTICRRSDLERPLSVFVELVPLLRELPGALGCSQETLSLLKRLTEFDGRGTDVSFTDDSTAAFAQMRRALFDLLDAVVGEQCLLVVIEDVQWLDKPSAKLLSAMVSWASTARLFFLLNERTARNVGRTQTSQLDLKVMELSPLEPCFAKDLVSAIVEQAPTHVPPEVIAWLLSVGEGNPFFLQELGKQWLETGKRHEFPPSIGAVVDDRLSRLSIDALQVLQTCAVLGVNASIERVERVLEFKSHRLLSAVQELSAAGMLQEESEATPDISGQLHTRHDLLSTAALKRLARTPLTFLHRRAGTVLEREISHNGVSSSLRWACAFHWRHAGDREKAFGAARFCAEHLLDVGLPADAVQAFERTLEYCVTDEQRLLILPRLVVALQMHGQWERSIAVLRNARQIQTRGAPTITAHDDVELALFDARWRASLENSTVLRDIRDCVASKDAPAGHRVTCGLLGLKIASDLSEIPVMRELYSAIVPLLKESALPQTTRSEIDMIFHSVCGDVETAAEATKHFLQIVRAEQNLLTFSRALGNAAVAHRLGGRRDEAERLFIEALEHAIAHGLKARAIFAAYSLVRLYLAAGDIRRARQMMDRADRVAQPGEDVHLAADEDYLAARISLEEGDIKAASCRYATIATQTGPNQSVNRRTAVLALGIRIAIAEHAGPERLRPLVETLETAHMINRGAGWQDFEAHALCLGLTACGEAQKGYELLTQYASVHRREKWPLPPAILELLSSCGTKLEANGNATPEATLRAAVLP